MAERDLTEKTFELHYSHNGRFLTIRDDSVTLSSSRSAKREFVEHPGSVMIFPMLNYEEVIVERVYRYPVGDTLFELPAGMIDPHESSLECARRELLEESGYDSRTWLFAGKYFNAPAYSSEFIDVWVARNLNYLGSPESENEPLEIVKFNYHELLQAAKLGRLRDMRSTCAILLADNALKTNGESNWQYL
jgi:ADP-ribose pyrophosphatase